MENDKEIAEAVRKLKPLNIEAGERWMLSAGDEVRYWVGERTGRGRVGRIAAGQKIFANGGACWEIEGVTVPVPAKNIKFYFSPTPTLEELAIGTPVKFWTGARWAEPQIGKIRTPVWLLGGTPVVSVSGYAGGIALTHIEVIKEEEV